MKEGQPQLTLYRGWLDPGKHVWSPFVTKLETRLRFAGLSYNTESGSVQKAPKGKIPYVEILRLDDGQPEQIGDSTLIIKDLVRRGVIPNINANLPEAVGAQDLAIRALLEEKLYFYHVRIHNKALLKSWIGHVLTGFGRLGNDGARTTT